MTEQRYLPDDVEPYGKTPLFTNETVPDKLLNHHDLQAGTWGLLTVEAGTVSFFRQGDDAPFAVISSGEPFVILPEGNSPCAFVRGHQIFRDVLQTS